MQVTYLYSLIGGALIGLASALYLLLDGRIAGVSGIIGGTLRPAGENQLRNAAFLLGLILGPIAYLVQRFQRLNHIKRRFRVCRTKYAQRAVG